MSDELRAGTVLDNYIIQAVLGRGSFGITYLARDKNLERRVAIKEYLPAGFAKRSQESTVHPLTNDDSEMFQYGLSTFLDEAKTIVKFNHPNIVRVLAFFEANNTAYIVMEYEEGQDLKAWLKANQHPSENRLLDIFSPINEGLGRIHQLGYIHRDIKPGNIYIRTDNTPVLIDFGAARDIFNKRLDSLTRILTRGYAPYEQDNPAWADQGPWTDIYALGATLHFALLGESAISSQERASAFMTGKPDPYPPLANRLQNRYSHHFLTAIDHALQFQPTERPQNVITWNRELRGEDNGEEGATLIVPVADEVSAEETFIQTKPQPLKTADTPRPDTSGIATSTVSPATSTSSRLFLLLGSMLVVLLAVGGYFYYLSALSPSKTPEAPLTTPKTVATTPGIQAATPKTATTTPQSAPDSAPDPALIMAKVETALLHVREAVMNHGKILRNQQTITDLEQSGSQTKFIATLKIAISGLEQNFESSFRQYTSNIREIHGYPETATNQAIDTLIKQKYQDKSLSAELGELLHKHAHMDTDENAWRSDLQELGKKLNQKSDKLSP